MQKWRRAGISLSLPRDACRQEVQRVQAGVSRCRGGRQDAALAGLVATEESSGGNADVVTVFRHEGFPPSDG